MSSSSVYGMGHGRPVDETFPLRPFRDPYPVTKAMGDAAVQRMIAEERLPAVIIRPDQIFGPGDHLHFGQMANRLLAGNGVVVGSGDNFMPFVYLSDLIDGLLLALDHPRAVGEAFNITNDRPLTQLQFLTAIAQEVGAKPPGTRIPYPVLFTAGFAAEMAAGITRTRRRPMVTRLGVAFFGTDNLYSIGKARGLLGYTPRVSISEGIRLSASWYLAQRSGEPAVASNAMAED
jgi:nucleoside-diphosphate-sugar epimerase